VKPRCNNRTIFVVGWWKKIEMAASESHSSHGCRASTPEDVPGGVKTMTSKVLDAGAGLLQSLKPIKSFQQVMMMIMVSAGFLVDSLPYPLNS
jgi:hypothetical protein